MADTTQDFEATLYTLPTVREPFAKESLADSTVDVIYIHSSTPASTQQEAQTSNLWTYTYISTKGQPLRSQSPHNGNHSGLENVIANVLSSRETNGRSTTPLIWVIDDSSAAKLLHTNLVSADEAARKQDQEKNSVSEKKCAETIAYTYGVVELQSFRADFTMAWMLFYNQMNIFNILRNYGLSRDHEAWDPKRSWILKFTKNPSTAVYVVMACMYFGSAGATYFINRGDEYQRLCVCIGLMAGVLCSLFFSADPGLPFPLYMIAGTTTASLLLSACGHWVWRRYYSTQDERLQKKLALWKEEARNMDKDTRVIKHHELL